MKKLSSSSGQALLIVLLSLAVILTIVLSVLSSSITDVAVVSRGEESLRAFSAAEAGVEQALILGQSGTVSLDKSSFNTQISTISKDQKYFIYPQDLLSGDTGVVWYVAHDSTGQLSCKNGNKCFKGNTVKVCWGKPGTSENQSNTPAIEIITYYVTDPGNYRTADITRSVYDPNAVRRTTNKFSPATIGNCDINGTDYSFSANLDFSAVPSRGIEGGLLFSVVKFIYNTDTAHSFGIDVNFAQGTLLPSQGRKITSTGTAGETTRKVEVSSLYRVMPSIFTNTIFSLGGITK